MLRNQVLWFFILIKTLSTNYLNPKQYQNPNVSMFKTAQVKIVLNI